MSLSINEVMDRNYNRPPGSEATVFLKKEGVCECGYDFYESPSLPVWKHNRQVRLTCPKCRAENLVTLPTDWDDSGTLSPWARSNSYP